MSKQENLLGKLGIFIAAKRWWVVGAGMVATILFGIIGASVPGQLSLSRFEAPGSESIVTREAMENTFKAGPPNILLLVEAKNGDVDAGEVAEAGQKLAEEFGGESAVAEVTSYWEQNNSAVLRSEDGSQAMILARMAGDATEARTALAGLSPKYTQETEVLSVRVGGQDEVFREVGAQAQQDFVRAELLVFPGVLLLLLLIFRRLSASLLTIGIGIFTIVGSLALLRVILPFADISTFAMNLILVMGLGLGLDYCLFIISRFREEVAKRSVHEAVAETVRTAGRTVLFSGVTVGAALAVLFVFPFPFLHSFGYAGIAIVIMGMIGAVVILPAALAILGKRVIPKRSLTAPEDGRWYKTALAVMKRPLLYGGMALAVLLMLGSPLLNLQFGASDDRMLPETASSRQVQDDIRENFTSEQVDALYVVSSGDTKQGKESVAYAEALSKVEGISQVNSVDGVFTNGERITSGGEWTQRYSRDGEMYFEATPTIERLESDPSGLVNDVRDIEAPFSATVGGYPAELYDFRTVLMERMPVAFGLIFVTTFVILFLMTSSIVLPLKAIIMNTLSLSVMFGALVWMFQEGNLSDILGFTATGVIEPSIPILMFCIAYGLSMDYEVFIISRIKEEWEKSKDNRQAVARGIQRSGPLVTAAAAILAFTFATYASSDIVFLQMLGIGMALSVLIDATIIRAVLVPAFMQVSSKVNWWAPEWMKSVAARVGLRE